MRNTLLAVIGLFLFNLCVLAQMEVVEIEKPQSAKSVAGVVVDPSGAVMGGVTVEECSEGWKAVLRTTETDDKGRFHFSPTRAKTVYYLEFSRHVFNWVRLTLQLGKEAKPAITVEMPLGR